MPTKRKASPARAKTARGARKKSSTKLSRTASSVAAMASAQLKNLRKTVGDLKSRLAKETKARALEARLARDAKAAREKLSSQMSALKEQGTRLSRELKQALGDATRREGARQQALAKVAELRAELSHRTEELKRKSQELAQLARESASRAKDIITGESHESAAAAPAESGHPHPGAEQDRPEHDRDEDPDL